MLPCCILRAAVRCQGATPYRLDVTVRALRRMPVPLLVDIAVAIVTTKVPILFAKGFWPMEAETRAD